MIEIDFEALKYSDLEVVNVEPTPEELRAFSAFLKKHRGEQALINPSVQTRSKRPRPMPAPRKNASADAK